ncbi:MAG: hypothetical protein HQM04_03575 [Magnetococcales bacterium]|nr:hypothetical protein [Magnetococcales bacterium]MBF0114104.1 hypothetical protein [Magnetococcales bacterium]
MGNALQLSGYQAVVLCEDVAHYRLAAEFLKNGALPVGKIYQSVAPSGQGSGKSWVLQRIAAEIKALRRRTARTVLLIIVDADEQATDDAYREIRKRIEESPNPVRHPVVAVVPTRNIESWIHYLVTGLIDETTSFKRHYLKNVSNGEMAARLLDRVCQAEHSATPLPPSLRMAREAWVQAFSTTS